MLWEKRHQTTTNYFASQAEGVETGTRPFISTTETICVPAWTPDSSD